MVCLLLALAQLFLIIFLAIYQEFRRIGGAGFDSLHCLASVEAAWAVQRHPQTALRVGRVLWLQVGAVAAAGTVGAE